MSRIWRNISIIPKINYMILTKTVSSVSTCPQPRKFANWNCISILGDTLVIISSSANVDWLKMFAKWGFMHYSQDFFLQFPSLLSTYCDVKFVSVLRWLLQPTARVICQWRGKADCVPMDKRKGTQTNGITNQFSYDFLRICFANLFLDPWLLNPLGSWTFSTLSTCSSLLCSHSKMGGVSKLVDQTAEKDRVRGNGPL